MRRWSLAMLGSLIVTVGWATGARALDVRIVPLEPRPGEHVTTNRPAIRFQLRSHAEVSVGRQSVHVMLDGRDVSDGITIDATDLSYVPPEPLAAGSHSVRVDVDDDQGGVVSYRWPFTVGSGASGDVPVIVGGDESAAPAAPPAPTATPAPAAQPNTFFVIDSSPYYWGDYARFGFIGAPGARGFLSVPGINGTFPFYPFSPFAPFSPLSNFSPFSSFSPFSPFYTGLPFVPFGSAFYYALVPVPFGFTTPWPFVNCHFFAPFGPSVIVRFGHRFHVIARSEPGGMSARHATSLRPTLAQVQRAHAIYVARGGTSGARSAGSTLVTRGLPAPGAVSRTARPVVRTVSAPGIAQPVLARAVVAAPLMPQPVIVAPVPAPRVEPVAPHPIVLPAQPISRAPMPIVGFPANGLHRF